MLRGWSAVAELVERKQSNATLPATHGDLSSNPGEGNELRFINLLSALRLGSNGCRRGLGTLL